MNSYSAILQGRNIICSLAGWSGPGTLPGRRNRVIPSPHPPSPLPSITRLLHYHQVEIKKWRSIMLQG